MPLEQVIFTEQLRHRSSRVPDYRAESLALRSLAETMAANSSQILQQLVQKALELCHAHSAGISILTLEENQAPFFRWEAVAGEWSHFVGGTMPRASSPCGTVLDRNASLALFKLARHYPLPPLPNARELVEVLLVPFHFDGKPMGTIWVVAHDDNRKFDSEDERVLQSLSGFASCAFQVLKTLKQAELTTANWRERSLASEQLRDSEEFNRSLMDGSADCVKVLDMDGKLLHMNEPGMCLMEIDDFAALKGKKWGELWPKQSEQEINGALQSARNGKASSFQAFCPTAKQTPKWWDVKVSPVLGVQHEVRHILVVSRDMTERVKSEDLLRDQEERLRIALMSADMGSWRVELSTGLATRDANLNRILGLPAITSTQPAQDYFNLIAPEDKASALDSWQKAIATRGVFEAEFRIKRADGEVRWIREKGRYINGENGATDYVTGVTMDVTSRKELETDLLRSIEVAKTAQAASEAASRAKDDFLAALSHELRTPLMPVLIAANALSEDTSLPSHVRDHFKMIDRNVTLEARLIDDLLDLTSIANGKLKLFVQPCDAHSLIGHAIEIVEEDAKAKGVKIRRNLLANKHVILADPVRFQQVIWNLLRNAVKFTPKGGEIAILSENGLGGETLVINVTDSGIGIDEAKLEVIFQPFDQGSLPGSHRFGGMGLGLSIARKVCELHCGNIAAKSGGKDLGSTFTVIFPTTTQTLERHPEAATDLSGASRRASVRPLKILLVEDHETSLNALTDLLRRDGHQVVGVGTLKKAVEAAQAESFDTVISDLGLPDGTGIDLMQELKSAYGLTGIALSGYGMDEDLKRSFNAGFGIHLIKPVRSVDLRKALATISLRPQSSS